MNKKLTAYIEGIDKHFNTIPAERREALGEVAAFVKEQTQSGQPAKLTFICTHNSRRSHLCQIWAATAAAYYGISEHIEAYSGGTEATAFNPRAVAALERAGFLVDKPDGDNPRYQVRFSENLTPMECFSKTYDDPTNPSENFAAIMTCSHADKNCPYIPGAALRVPIPYVDPKVSDGSIDEVETYDERCRQIATEMFYLMSVVAEKN